MIHRIPFTSVPVINSKNRLETVFMLFISWTAFVPKRLLSLWKFNSVDDTNDQGEALLIKEGEFEMACDNNANRNMLPEDMLIEIFIRSSVKCLLRARCVCKYWYDLIKDPSFEYKHLHFQKHMKKECRLLQYRVEETSQYKFTNLDDKSQSSTTCDILDQLDVPGFFMSIEGPINGLYCLFNNLDSVVLLNPALMNLKTLPLPPSHGEPYYTLPCGLFGFGVDPLTNDYKVVISRFCEDENEEIHPDPLVTVYSLSTNTWRIIDFEDHHLDDYPLWWNKNSLFLNGTYHWWVETGSLLAFHMGKESFRVIPCPDDCRSYEHEDTECYSNTTLSVYEDCVSLQVINDLLVDIWVMLEEGMWVRQFSIGPIPSLIDSLGFFGNKGVLLLLGVGSRTETDVHKSQTVLYDVITQEMVKVGPIAVDHSLGTCIYYESLVSIVGGTTCKSMHDTLKMVSSFLKGDPSF